MTQDIRRQRTCYFASGEYADSFWGRHIWLFQGKASLRLTAEALILEGHARDRTIPLDAIKSVGLGRFSESSKPFGLERLVVRYTLDGEPETVHLVPCESGLDPSWETSRLVESWFETLGQVEALSGRIEPPSFDPVAPPSRPKLAALAITCLMLALVPVLVTWLIVQIR